MDPDTDDARQLMIDVCELLMADCFSVLRNEPATSNSTSNVVDWFKSWAGDMELLNSQESVMLFKEKSCFRVRSHLASILKDFLLNHKWSKSNKVLQVLANDPVHSPIPLWKVGLEILYTEPQKNAGLIDHHIRKIKMLKELEGKEVMLEFMMYLLHNGELEDAKRALQDIPILHGQKRPTTSSREYQDLVLQAYRGLLHYITWMEDKERVMYHMVQVAGSEILQGMVSDDVDNEAMRINADKALTCFSALHTHPGVWDIFLTRHIQILEHYERLTEAWDILEGYRDSNPDNPNAHKYLYSFFVKHSLGPRHEATVLLKAVADRIPSDTMVMDLCDRYIEERNIRDLLTYIFDLKDYKCWQNDERSWRILSTALQLARDGDDEMIQLHWEPRQSWWPTYHFTYVGWGVADMDMWLQRACCAVILTRTKSEFVSRVRRALDQEQTRKFDEVADKVLTFPGIT